MKRGNYEELNDKFYAGTATPEEIHFLKSEGLLNEEDIIYAASLKEERAKKMNWKFEDFMQEMPSAKVVVLSNRRITLKRIMAVAAAVIMILVTYVFWPQTSQKPEIAAVPVFYKRSDSVPQPIAKTGLPANEIKKASPEPHKMERKSSENRDYAVKSNQQGTAKKKTALRAKEKEETKTDFGEYLVMVNGKPITNEEEAVAITRESLSLVSRNLTTTADELKPIVHLKIKL